MPYKILQNPVLSGHNHCHFVCSLRGDFNPLSPCGERQDAVQGLNQYSLISTHSPRVGRDALFNHWSIFDWISTHSPRVGRDRFHFARHLFCQKISTHSPRVGRDQICPRLPRNSANFNPLSPCGERRRDAQPTIYKIGFQPTLPVWGETRYCGTYFFVHTDISTHSPRVGRDTSGELEGSYDYNFNPLSPCGERPGQ